MTTLNYDDLATEYARHRTTYPGLVEHIVEYSGVTAASTVLEVGCGTANHLAAIRRGGATCYGVDPSAQMLQKAAERPEKLDLGQGTAEELDFPDQTFDLIMSVDVIHYIREPSRYFERAFAALKPGGRIVTVTDSDWVIRNRMPIARYFPAIVEVEFTRYHPIPALAGELALAGFRELYERLVESEYELRDASRFRDKSYSCLHLISDDEYAVGLAALEADLARGPVPGTLRSLALWGRRPA
jgi:ubiquinone/menaquinone biosynthesis C-methylase UbiE